jgi:phthalate 4,5-dioxygenase oxygenase subunit
VAGITREENELLTRTGPGTPMGRLFRQYWIPAMLAERLPEPDGAPIAIQLLGERLVAFRDSKGRVGLLDEFCPHRRASLVYGRNEECGLRCVYHGWKFDVTGKVIETPAERNPDFGKAINQVAYPTREAGGIVWTYMGPEDEPPPFPDWLFTKLPAHQVSSFHYNQACNFLQGMEADLDIAHPSFLHGTINQAPLDERRAAIAFDPHPQAFAREDQFGLQTVWRWNMADPSKSLFWVDPFILPCHTITPSGRTQRRFVWHAWVPIDDHHHWAYYVHYDPDAPNDPEERNRIAKAFGHDTIDPQNEWRPRGNRSNMYFLDRKQQKHQNYSGINGIAVQDLAITESMGPIVDRTKENLGAGDALVARLRRFLIKVARQMETGEISLPSNGKDFPDIDTRMVIAAKSTTYEDVLKRRDWTWGEIADV